MPDNLILYTCPECGQSMMLPASKAHARKRCPGCAKERRRETSRKWHRRHAQAVREGGGAQAASGRKRTRGNRFGVPEPHIPRGNDGIDRISRQARERGLSYGQYVALMEKEGKA